MRFLRVISRLPFWFWYGVSDVLAFLAYRVVRYRRNVVEENLHRAFPEKSDAERQRITKDFYRNLGDVIVESLKTISISPEALRRRVRPVNPELLLDPLARGEGVLVMTSHQCNWEWLLLGSSLFLAPYPILAVYRPLHNQFFDELMQQIRGRFGATPTPDRRLLREVATLRNQPFVTAMVADQAPAPEHGYWTHFLHQETAFFRGSDRIAQAAGLRVLFTRMVRVGRGHYEISFTPIAAPPYNQEEPSQILDRYVEEAEAAIRATPADWLWSHKRWKHRRPEGMPITRTA
ncbi:KDO2-lipid IV(A) lauroyltransferase [Catalinimonas alkaloidigena]|uniref:KDO2-lipid IV(A) lauroyltransferase n=1 Tax=Catalinimonas alkaloidigena TaxID=1075417 RepID=A0A1G9AKN2_9BACT|nr:lysophospholipid acyltransferase family protein [Catalinimonas alkaloidigena]SDK27848.1 KDO2-lipid IV(A) lauroyltransferase [Catalinimonas alkaloidigena]